MTTVMWDGKSLVADSQLTHFEHMPKTERLPKWLRVIAALCKARYDKNAQCQKIFAPTNFTFGGERVQAVGLAGQGDMIDWVADQCAHGNPVELTDGTVYPGYFFDMIAVLEDHVVYVSQKPSTAEVTWQKIPRQLSYPGQLTVPTSLAVGSGMLAIRHCLTMGLDGQVLVSMACVFDLFSGGTLTVWNPQENGGAVRTGVPRMPGLKAIQAVSQRTKEVNKLVKLVKAGKTPEQLPDYICKPS